MTDAGPGKASIPVLDSAPDWFHRAVAVQPESRFIEVAGAPIHYAVWGRGGADKPALIFSHGSAAHVRWWSFVAPFLSDAWEVVALDLSGNGDSGWRDTYDVPTRADEIVAVCADSGLFDKTEKPILLGHSFGSVAAVHAISTWPERFSGYLLIDPPLFHPDKPYPRGDREVKPNRTYTSPEEALSRFRLEPAQPLQNDYVIDYVARTSLKPVRNADGTTGWTWKFDPAIYAKAPKQDFAVRLNTLRGKPIKVGLLYGTRSPIVQPDRIGFILETFAGWGPVVPIPDAHHHLMLDEPLAFVTGVRTILTCWRVEVGGS